MDATAKKREESHELAPDSAQVWRMSRLTRDAMTEPISRDRIIWRELGQGNIIFPVQLTTNRIGNLTRLIYTLLYGAVVHIYIHTYTYSQAQKNKFEQGKCFNFFWTIFEQLLFRGCCGQVRVTSREVVARHLGGSGAKRGSNIPLFTSAREKDTLKPRALVPTLH